MVEGQRKERVRHILSEITVAEAKQNFADYQPTWRT